MQQHDPQTRIEVETRMARLQILHLPSFVDGEQVIPRFALVLDQCTLDEQEVTEYQAWAASIGAVGLLSTRHTVDVVTGSADTGDDDEEDTTVAMVGLVWDKDQPDITKTVVAAAREVLSRFTPTSAAAWVDPAGSPWPTKDNLERVVAESATRTEGRPA